jgi:hypothetical protein
MGNHDPYSDNTQHRPTGGCQNAGPIAALFCLRSDCVSLASISEIRHHVLREQLHRMENSLLWHSTPIEHYHQVCEAYL